MKMGMLALVILFSLTGMLGLPLPDPGGSIQTPPVVELPAVTPEDTATELLLRVGEDKFTVVLTDTAAAQALLERLPMTVIMQELNGNEKFYYLPDNLPTASQRPGQIAAGDLMLYGSNCLVLFYENFSTSYSYTRLGGIDDPTGLALALGRGSVEVTMEPS